MDNFIVNTFGVSPMTFAIVVVFWAFVFVIILGDGMAATFTTCIFASITAWLIGKLGAVVFILLVVAIIVVYRMWAMPSLRNYATVLRARKSCVKENKKLRATIQIFNNCVVRPVKR